MDTCTRSQGSQMKSKLSIRRENISDGLLSFVRSLLKSRKNLCTITDSLKSGKKGDVIEITFLGLSVESGTANIKNVVDFHMDIPELVRSLHLCNLNENEVLFLKDWNVATYSVPQSIISGILCIMASTPLPCAKTDSLFSLLSKYMVGVRHAMEQDSMRSMNKKGDQHEDDDTNQSVSSIEDDFVTAFEHLDEEESIETNDNQGIALENIRNQRDASSQTCPANCLDVSGSKIMFSSVRRRSSVKSSVLMGYMGLPDISAPAKNTVTTSMCSTWKQRSISNQDKSLFSPSPVESSESECSSPSPIIFLDEEGYQKSLRAKLNLPKIPVGKDGIEDSDSELSEFFDSFDRFDGPEHLLEDHSQIDPKPVLASPPKKRKCAKVHVHTVCMNPQKFKFDQPTLSASVKKPTPRKAESPFSSVCDVPESPRPAKTTTEDNGTLFSPIRSSAFSPPGVPITLESSPQLVNQNGFASCKDSYAAFSDYANSVCIDMFNSVLNVKPSPNLVIKEQEKTTKPKRKTRNVRESDRRLKSKHKSIKGGIQKFASDLVEKSFGSAFKDLQRGVSSCTSALCHLAARLTSYVFQMAFYEIGRRQAFSIKKRAINGLANLMVSEVITSALQELRYIKKQMVTNAVTRFAADLAEELVFEGIMEVCQFSHPPTPTMSYCQSFNYEDLVVSSYAEDLSESVIQEAFIELSQVNVSFTTEAAISVSMNNLKSVSSECMMPSTQSSSTIPAASPEVQLAAACPTQTSKRDYTVQYALFFTSGLMSSVPVPLAAKVLSQPPTSNDHSHMSASEDLYIDNMENNFSRKRNETTAVLPSSKNNDGSSNGQEHLYLDFAKQDGVTAFSVTMVDMVVNEAYDVIKSASTVEDYAENIVSKVIEVPSKQLSVAGTKSQFQNTDDLPKGNFTHSLGKNTQILSKTWKVNTPSMEMPINLVSQNTSLLHDPEMLHCTSNLAGQRQRIFRSPQATAQATPGSSVVRQSTQDYKCGPPLNTSNRITNTSHNAVNTEVLSIKSINGESSDTSLFGLQNCLPHINSFSSVMCSCGDDFFTENRSIQKDSSVPALPGTPPPTPLTTYDISPERSMRKLNKRLKGQLAKEFYPATPPSTPHMSAFEYDNSKKDDFMLHLMRSLSEEVESSSSDESSEEFEVSEETFRYANYLSVNIVSSATDLAAYCLDDDASQGATVRNRSQLNMLSDKWGYPSYMRNITEESLETLCRYASGIASGVINDAKEVMGSRKNSVCDTECFNSHNCDKDCRPKDRGSKYRGMSFKASDCTTLSLPLNNGSAGLTSKYPSCESVTEEYADHLIRVLKMEGGNSELILDQYASRLAYRAIKSGLQEASKTVKVKCNRKRAPRAKSDSTSSKDILRLLSRNHHSDNHKHRPSNTNLLSLSNDTVHAKDLHKEFTGLLHFAESLAQTITCDVRRNLKISAASLPKSLTDSCLYTKCKNDYSEIVKSAFPKTMINFPQKKLYHSTGNLSNHGLSEGLIQAIEQYACKVVDSTLEFSMETARLQAAENRKKPDKGPFSGSILHSYGIDCRLCGEKEQQGNPRSSCHFLLGQDDSQKHKQCSKFNQSACQKPRLFHLNIPKIHIDLDKRAVIADKIVNAAIEKAALELSNTSLTADSGNGHDRGSFAEGLTTEIMLSAMKNIGHVVNISSLGKDGFRSADSVASQQTIVSVGDDSTGSWSNLSFEEEHQDESSSFLHLSDSNGNSSSWSSLGLEGDMCEENVSFPSSDSDGAEEKEEDPDVTRVTEQHYRMLLIRNVDLGPSTAESQLRTTLQWIAASASDISDICFPEHFKKDLFLVFRRVREKGWKIGDLLQAVLQYCETFEVSSDLPGPFFGWLLENY